MVARSVCDDGFGFRFGGADVFVYADDALPQQQIQKLNLGPVARIGAMVGPSFAQP
jgi:hypothetical protein